jgi:hypothetical protein
VTSLDYARNRETPFTSETAGRGMIVKATRLIRKMRGGAQSHLFECDSGTFYVVKFRNNPQHPRILVNEWISSLLLRYLCISSPEAAIVDLTPEFLEGNPDVYIQLGSRKTPVAAGWHFGSRYPGDPSQITVYDFVPDLLLGRVVNLREFLGVLAFDKWTGNADARQSIFFRAQSRYPRDPQGDIPPRSGFIASMVDHGYVFSGPHWRFPDSPMQGLYFRPLVYKSVRSFDDFQPWLDQIVHFPEEVLTDTLTRLPPEWIDGQKSELETLLERLIFRCKRVPDLIRASREGRIDPFPNWR